MTGGGGGEAAHVPRVWPDALSLSLSPTHTALVSPRLTSAMTPGSPVRPEPGRARACGAWCGRVEGEGEGVRDRRRPPPPASERGAGRGPPRTGGRGSRRPRAGSVLIPRPPARRTALAGDSASRRRARRGLGPSRRGSAVRKTGLGQFRGAACACACCNAPQRTGRAPGDHGRPSRGLRRLICVQCVRVCVCVVCACVCVRASGVERLPPSPVAYGPAPLLAQAPSPSLSFPFRFLHPIEFIPPA